MTDDTIVLQKTQLGSPAMVSNLYDSVVYLTLAVAQGWSRRPRSEHRRLGLLNDRGYTDLSMPAGWKVLLEVLRTMRHSTSGRFWIEVACVGCILSLRRMQLLSSRAAVALRWLR